MASTPAQTPFMALINKNLHWAERLFLIGVAIGAILMLNTLDSSVTKVSLIGLAVTFFLYAYKPIDIPRGEDERFGFSEFFGLTIAPKILWISAAISTFGVFLYFFGAGNKGFKQMLLIGGSTIFIASAILLILLISGVKNLRIITPVLFRALPLLVIDFYIFLK
jgi:hypothetical protein